MHKKPVNKAIAVYYHGNCPDGFGGAYAAWKKLGQKADYIPLLWQNVTSEETEAPTVYFIDFTPEALIKKFKAEGKKIIIIDHHISAKPHLLLADESLFDINMSGAGLSWRHFHGKKKLPKLLAHVQDQDIWTFKLRGTKEINKAIALRDFDFKVWQKLEDEMNDSAKYKALLNLGANLLKMNDVEVSVIISEGIREALLDGKKAYVVNCPINESIIGNTMAKDGALGIIWAERRGGVIKVSLRSTGNIDVSKIAKKYGGGGHKNASGFILKSINDAPWTYKT
jgi:uncharacterized protein